MQRLFLSIASITGGLSIVLGAFGAHTLKVKFKLTPEQLQTFDTGVKYQMYHTFAIIAVALLMDKFPGKSGLTFAGYSFLIGIILFSGSLYLLSTRNILGIESWKWLGPITPFGGLFFLVGWIMVLLVVLSKQNS